MDFLHIFIEFKFIFYLKIYSFVLQSLLEVKMEILEIILYTLFVFFIAFLVIGFNKQMNERAKAREERFSKLNKKGDENE